MPERLLLIVCGVLAAVLVALRLARTSGRCGERTTTMRRLSDDAGNESLIVTGDIGDIRGAPFLVDTAYAGAPVVSLTFLALRETQRAVLDRAGRSDKAWKAASRVLASTTASEAQQLAALDAFLAGDKCRTFTAGCAVTLMGIGATNLSRGEMLLCPGLRVAGRDCDVDADVLVTHELNNNVSILTMDFLLHRQPVILRPRAQTLTLFAQQPPHGDFELFESDLVGGAFRVPIAVNGVAMSVFVDTGASMGLCVSEPRIARLLAACPTADTARHIVQRGVHSETVCSDVIEATVAIGKHSLEQVQVLLNNTRTEGADGYMGLGLLRAFDMWFTTQRIGFRPNGLGALPTHSLRKGTCDGSVLCAS
tara:strand:- start:341 stop:1438 length:1098 start_codon:yes stop_codon:yes gene_type:complete